MGALIIGLLYFDFFFLFLALTPDLQLSNDYCVVLHVAVSAANVWVLGRVTGRVATASIIVLMGGTLIECFQSGIPGRTSGLDDILVDLVGIFLGSMTSWAGNSSIQASSTYQVQADQVSQSVIYNSVVISGAPSSPIS